MLNIDRFTGMSTNPPQKNFRILWKTIQGEGARNRAPRTARGFRGHVPRKFFEKRRKMVHFRAIWRSTYVFRPK